MDEYHQVRLLSTFQHVDNIVTEAERILASGGSPDATATQRRFMHDCVVRMRERMRGILHELQIPVNLPTSSARWAALGRLSFARIALAEIEPERMRGHGPLTEEEVKVLERLGAELDTELRQIADHLQP
jgi:hypothetical protein